MSSPIKQPKKQDLFEKIIRQLKVQSTDERQSCYVHFEQFIGFCESDNKLLCGSCLLEGDREYINKNVIDINDAYNNEKQNFLYDKDVFEQVLQLNLQKQENVQQKKHNVQEYRDNIILAIRDFYNNLIEQISVLSIHTQEIWIQLLESQKSRLEQQETNLQQQQKVINEIKIHYSKVENQSQIEFLQQTEERLDLLKKLKQINQFNQNDNKVDEIIQFDNKKAIKNIFDYIDKIQDGIWEEIDIKTQKSLQIDFLQQFVKSCDQNQSDDSLYIKLIQNYVMNNKLDKSSISLIQTNKTQKQSFVQDNNQLDLQNDEDEYSDEIDDTQKFQLPQLQEQ